MIKFFILISCFHYPSVLSIPLFLIIMQLLEFLRGGAETAVEVDTSPTVADCNCNWLEQFFTYEASVDQPHPCLGQASRSISFMGDGTWPEIQLIFNGSLKIDWGAIKKERNERKSGTYENTKSLHLFLIILYVTNSAGGLPWSSFSPSRI